jgi:protein TonB
MDLRALLFTSDGGSTATLCRLLAELGIEAEICPEMLVAVGRLSTERYDAIIVDWAHEDEAALLLKTAREKKAQGLNLVLVSDDTSIPRALQQGANSVIKKPIDVVQARDTLSTARDLILSRRFEQRDKDARNAAVRAESEAAPELPVVAEEPAQKSGFLPQTMMQSALEAEQKVVKPNYSTPSTFQVARGPASLQQEQEVDAPAAEPVSKKRWDDVRAVFRENPEEPKPEPVVAPRAPQDSTGVFSSFQEQPETSEETGAELESFSPPRYLIFAVVACLLVAAVLYVFAPGGAYLGKVSSAFHSFSLKSIASHNQPAEPQPRGAVTEKPSAAAESAATSDDAADSDPGPIPTGEIDPNKIQIIETKAIPKAGAQLPPKDAPDNPDTSSQPAISDGTPTAPASTVPVAEAPAPGTQSAVAPPPPTPEPVPVQPPAPAPPSQPTSGEPRTGVIIPDSLKNSPSANPASSLEPSSVPEETSLALLVHKVDPDYPQQALSQHIEGPVVLQAWIARDGTVRDLKLVKGYFVLGKAAFDAVKQWRFKPYTPNGKAIDFQTMLTVNFKHPN